MAALACVASLPVLVACGRAAPGDAAPAAAAPADDAAARASGPAARHATAPLPAGERLDRGTLYEADPLMFRACGAAAPTRVEDATGGALEAVLARARRDGAGHGQGESRGKGEGEEQGEGRGQGDGRGMGPGTYVEVRLREAGGALRVAELRRAVPGEGRRCDGPIGYEWRAHGNEPFWTVELRDGRLVHVAPGAGTLEFGAVERAARDGTREFQARLPGHALRLTLVRGDCFDTMSGEYGNHVAELELDGRRMTGCAAPGLPDAPRG